MDKKLDSIVASYSQKIISCVCESIRIPSVVSEPEGLYPYGRAVDDALQHALSVARGLGFETCNLDGKVAWADYGRGSDIVAAMGHLDVVVPGDEWSFHPFCGEIRDGYILGRGSQDDKGPVFSTLFAMKAVAELGVPLSKKIRIIFGTDEESGHMRDVEAYLQSQGPPLMAFTPDGEYPVVNTEKGSIRFRVSKKRDNSMSPIREITGSSGPGTVPDAAKATVNAPHKANSILKSAYSGTDKITALLGADSHIELSARGKAAHGSLPELGDNAIARLLRVLCDHEIGGEFIGALMLGADTGGDAMGIRAEHPHSGKVTVNMYHISGDDAGIEACYGVYVPANTISTEEVMGKICAFFEPSGAKVEFIKRTNPMYMPEDSRLIRTLQAGYQNATGLEPALKSMCGGTYSKKMPNMVPFGATFPGEDDRAHGANERLLVSNLLESTRIMAYAILEMGR